jgi:hypothetical protein
MIRRAARVLRATPVRAVFHRLKAMIGATAQSDEHEIMERLATAVPRTFVEFGFHPTEFNCARLAKRFSGLLIDGDISTVRLAKRLLPDQVQTICAFLTLDNVEYVVERWLNERPLGVLSIDVDGNDYWFLERLLPLRPGVIAVEYNASLGLESCTVPYDPAFERHEKHASGWYHGASLMALSKLCGAHGYGLAAVSKAGANAFFTEAGSLDPVNAWRPNQLRDKWSQTDVGVQWNTIRDLPYVGV